jgi:hypothetical protein
MHDLLVLEPAIAGGLVTSDIGELFIAEIEQTKRYAEAEKAAATRRAYATDWRDFVAWCAQRGATALPAHVGIVAALATIGLKASTIGRRAASIGYHHKLAGHEPPTSSEAVKTVLRGIRGTIGAARAGKAPATADVLMQMVALCPAPCNESRSAAATFARGTHDEDRRHRRPDRRAQERTLRRA